MMDRDQDKVTLIYILPTDNEIASLMDNESRGIETTMDTVYNLHACTTGTARKPKKQFAFDHLSYLRV